VIAPGAGAAPVYVANFGVLVADDAASADAGVDAGAGRARYGYVCEEAFGGKLPDRVARHPDGRLFMAGFDGLHVANAPTDSCSFHRAGGSLAWQDVAEVAFDPIDPAPMASPTKPRRIYALSRTPSALHVSSDDGATFSQVYAFAPELHLVRLFVEASGAAAPAGPRTIYASGYTAQQALVLARSDDDGVTFTVESFASADFGRVGVLTVLEGPRPGAPGTLFLAAGAVSGADEIWRSVDRGHSWARVLTLPGTESRAGFAFGEGGAIYVAGSELGVAAGAAPAHLVVSHDGGASFGPPRASGPAGPRYRCLAAAQGRLYACGDPARDDLMFGVSDDEGATWTPTATLTDITGPRACTRGRCAATDFWLCQSYGICSDDLPAPEQRDAQAADVADVDAVVSDGPAATGRDESGCGCRLGGPSAAPGRHAGLASALLVVLALSSRAAVRARRRRGFFDVPPRRCS
jgi:hypothetical protein